MVKIFTAKNNAKHFNRRSKAIKPDQASKQNSRQSVTIDSHDHAGNGICLSTKPITIVNGALMGESCEISLSKQSKKVNFANVVKVIVANPARVRPFCEYYEKCGGCSLQHVSAADGLALKQKALQDYLSKTANIENTQSGLNKHNKPSEIVVWQPSVPTFSCADVVTNEYSSVGQVHEKVTHAYRRRIRLAIDARNPKQIKIGFRAANSKNVVDIKYCAVATNVINNCLKFIQEELITLNGLRKIGHMVITEGLTTLQLAIYVTGRFGQQDIEKLQKWSAAHSIYIVVKCKKEIIFDSELNANTSTHAKNIASIWVQDIENVCLNIDSEHFLQVNQKLNSKMLQQAIEWLQANHTHTLFDFFCGSGNFALALAPYVSQVRGFEGVNNMVFAAKQNASAMGLTNCQFSCLDLSDDNQLAKLSIDSNALVILDPSRDGAMLLCEHLRRHKVQKILYVSCNPNTFARDAKCLQKNYKLAKISTLDMFPYTKHIELMALFVSI